MTIQQAIDVHEVSSIPPPPPPPFGRRPAVLNEPGPPQYVMVPVPVHAAQGMVVGNGPALYGVPQPAAPVSVETGTSGDGVRVRILPLVGALVAVIGSFIPWVVPGGGSPTSDSHDIPAVAAYGDAATSPEAMKLGVVIVALATIGAVLALVRAAGPIYRLAGVATMAAAAGWAYHAHEELVEYGIADQFFSIVGAGFWTTLAGGAILAATR